MSVTSKIAFTRGTQPISNAYGPMAGPTLGRMSGAPASAAAAPTTLSQMSGNQVGEVQASFGGIVFGVVATIAIWWAITWILEKLLPHHDTPHFLEDFLHGLRVALIVGAWFVLMKMTTGVPPFNQIPSYKAVVRAF